MLKSLERIEAAARGNARLAAIQEELASGDARLKQFLVTANNSFITFGIASLPKPAGGGLFFQNEIQWADELFELVEELAARRLTGGDAKNKIAAFLDDCNELQRKWASRFFLKDLRLNVGTKALQGIVGKDALPIFEVPLAEDYRKVPSAKMKGMMFAAQPKLDGGRCVAFVDVNGIVDLKSRTGHTWTNFESVRVALQKLATTVGLKSYVFDGEVVSLDTDGKVNFQQIQKTFHADVEVGFLQYVVFDGCELDEWMNPKLTYRQRLRNGGPPLLNWYKSLNQEERLVSIETEESEYTEDIANTFCQQFVAEGYEGVMFRALDEVVVNKRRKTLIKVKTFIDAEAEVIGFAEGGIYTKYAGMMGALKCRLKSGIEFEVGSGWSDDERKQYYGAGCPIGAQLTFRYFELTDDGKPRLPSTKGLRSAVDTPDETEAE